MSHVSSRRLVRHSLPFIALLAMAPLANMTHAGAWVPALDAGYAKVGVTRTQADEIFDSEDDVNFEGVSLSYYGEIGLGKKLGLYWSFLYQDIEQTVEGVTTANNGLGDIDLGVRYQWFSEPFVFSTSALVKIPYLYDNGDALPLGNGQEDVEVRALIGKGLNQFGYFGLEFGYRARFDAPSDEYRYLIEYGYSVNDHLYLRTKLDGTLSAGNADVAESIDNGVNLALTPEFDLGKLELTAGWNFGQKDVNGKQWGMELTYTNDIFGEQILNGNSVQLALTHVF